MATRSSSTGRGKENVDRMWSLGLSTARIEALCDGVFAIAMTILVLEIAIPGLEEPAHGEVSEASLEMIWDLLATEFVPYAFGFLTLGVYWILHHYIFHFIRRSDGVLAWLNIVFLMLITTDNIMIL